MPNTKRQHGIYYTALRNPFTLKPFKNWIAAHRLQNERIVEPFAGSNSLIRMLQEIGLASSFSSYDLYPQNSAVQKRDSLARYPKGFAVCVSNPPWLYKSSAHRRGLAFPNTPYDDIYKLCIATALRHNSFVAMLIPASFIQSGLFRDRLEKVIFLNKPLFKDTQNPVCLALFSNVTTKDIKLYHEATPIGTYQQLTKHLPPTTTSKNLTFNAPTGSLGFIAIDNNRTPSIRFCKGTDLSSYTITTTSRSITRIDGITTTTALLDKLNNYVASIRTQTNDIFLTAFKGLRKDGSYRRRMEYTLARNVIEHCRHNKYDKIQTQ